MMKLKDFDYTLPQELIAQQPLRRRDQARLMVINRKTQKIQHDIFENLGKYLPKKSMLVVNNSKVIPARLFGKKMRTGGKVEIFLLDKLYDGYSYRVMMRPMSKIKEGEEVVFDGSDVERIDAASLQLITCIFKQAEEYGSKVSWQASSDALKKASQLLGLTKALDLYGLMTLYMKTD